MSPSSDPKRDNTISDEEWQKIRDNAAKVEPPMFSPEAVNRRKASGEQRDKARWS